MKTTSLLIFGMLLVSQLGFSQTEKQEIVRIDALKREMDQRMNKYDKKETQTTQSGLKTFYSENQELKVVVLKVIDDGKEKNVSWYYQSGQLLFSETTWIALPSKGLPEEKVEHYKVYAAKGHLIAWIKQDNTFVDPGSQDFKTADQGVIAQAKIVQKEFYK